MGYVDDYCGGYENLAMHGGSLERAYGTGGYGTGGYGYGSSSEDELADYYKDVKFLRPDGRFEMKSIGWCRDSGAVDMGDYYESRNYHGNYEMPGAKERVEDVHPQRMDPPLHDTKAAATPAIERAPAAPTHKQPTARPSTAGKLPYTKRTSTPGLLGSAATAAAGSGAGGKARTQTARPSPAGKTGTKKSKSQRRAAVRLARRDQKQAKAANRRENRGNSRSTR